VKGQDRQTLSDAAREQHNIVKCDAMTACVVGKLRCLFVVKMSPAAAAPAAPDGNN